MRTVLFAGKPGAFTRLLVQAAPLRAILCDKSAARVSAYSYNAVANAAALPFLGQHIAYTRRRRSSSGCSRFKTRPLLHTRKVPRAWADIRAAK